MFDKWCVDKEKIRYIFISKEDECPQVLLKYRIEKKINLTVHQIFTAWSRINKLRTLASFHENQFFYFRQSIFLLEFYFLVKNIIFPFWQFSFSCSTLKCKNYYICLLFTKKLFLYLHLNYKFIYILLSCYNNCVM